MMDALEDELHLSKEKSLIKFTTICPYMVDTGLCKKPKINKMYVFKKKLIQLI